MSQVKNTDEAPNGNEEQDGNNDSIDNNEARKVGAPGKKEGAMSARLSKSRNARFVFGNYPTYYGRRGREVGKIQGEEKSVSEYVDDRIELFDPNWFRGKRILDVGCNTGMVDMIIASKFRPHFIHGIDLDRSLVKRARTYFQDYGGRIPTRIQFQWGNIVSDEIGFASGPVSNFDCALCLSVSKWVHLHKGDEGVEKMFRKIFSVLKPGGRMILEAQPWKSYKQSIVTERMRETLKSIKISPSQFPKYLVETIGFDADYQQLRELSRGFSGRPIYVFTKPPHTTVATAVGAVTTTTSSSSSNTITTTATTATATTTAAATQIPPSPSAEIAASALAGSSASGKEARAKDGGPGETHPGKHVKSTNEAGKHPKSTDGTGSRKRKREGSEEASAENDHDHDHKKKKKRRSRKHKKSAKEDSKKEE